MEPQEQDFFYSFRYATEDDLPELLRIEREVHFAPWTEEHFRSELNKPYSQFLVLTDDETDTQIIGYLVCWILFEECQILNMAVDIPYRGLGFGRKMIRQSILLAQQKKLRRVVLDVRKTNQPAIQLYQDSGFTIQWIRKEYYSNGEDAYHMILLLEEDRFHFEDVRNK